MLHHAAVQGAQGHAACGWHERAKREWVLGRSAENLYRWVWAGRTACVAGRPLETMHQPMGGWAMRGHFKSAQISRGCFAAIAVIRFLSLSADCRLCPVSRQRQAPGISELCGAWTRAAPERLRSLSSPSGERSSKVMHAPRSRCRPDAGMPAAISADVSGPTWPCPYACFVLQKA